VLFVVSSAQTMTMADGSRHETGYFAEEALTPYERFVAAGVDVVVATPDGQPPHADPYGLEPMFHYPDEDEDFLLSVIRSFRHDVDDIRVTLQHLTELDLIACRRIFEALKGAGASPEAARRMIEAAAVTAWAENRNLTAVLGESDEVTSLVPPDRIRALAQQVQDDSAVKSAAVAERLASLPGFQAPLDLREVTDEELAEFDAVFIPGGHGPMVDMAENPDVRRALRIVHERDGSIAALCHGPAALLSAGPDASGNWLFDGYRLTSFTDQEEDQTRPGRLGMPWYLETALKNAGAVFDDAAAPWTSHVVVDRNVITAQNPMSADAVADAVLKRLGA
jgi:putative intracellular protease/amidase